MVEFIGANQRDMRKPPIAHPSPITAIDMAVGPWKVVIRYEYWCYRNKTIRFQYLTEDRLSWRIAKTLLAVAAQFSDDEVEKLRIVDGLLRRLRAMKSVGAGAVSGNYSRSVSSATLRGALSLT